MTSKPDDLDAVRQIVALLQQFDDAERQRIMRWVHEKMGLAVSPPASPPAAPAASIAPASGPTPPGNQSNIRAFVTEKSPNSDNQFAAVVAYFHRFVALEPARKPAINAEDLQEACRLAGRNRLPRPGQTLINAHTMGLLDKAERGAYSISTVGENLVAVSLPGANGGSARPRPVKRAGKKGSK